ncbi:MAG: hypothetical protein HYX61_08325 [Gammaproteobacteria bacterium]|jgi:hypothetical protein|nr:hypothetical protein [Gammaproteobacteria bacterium]
MHGDSATPDITNPYYKQEVGSPNPEAVLQEIIERQIELNHCRRKDIIQESRNYQSLKKTEKALNEFFNPTVIAIQNALPLLMPQIQPVSNQEQKKSHRRAKPITKHKELQTEKVSTPPATADQPTSANDIKLKGPKGGREVV